MHPENDRPIILIVEDDETMGATLETILKKNYRVIKASDGESGLEIVKKTEVNLILLDIMLPGLDGLEVLKLLKSNIKPLQFQSLYLPL